MLGPLRIWDGAAWSPIKAAQQRLVLAMLLAEAGRIVTTERLVDEIWGERPPRAAVSTVQNHVLRLRRILGRGPLLTRGRGYELVVADGELDAQLFEGLVAQGRRMLADGQRDGALTRLTEGLALWQGRALADVPNSPTVEVHAARLEQSRLTALEERVGAELELGRHAEVVDELRALVAEHPLRERLWAHLMLALYRCDRRAEALEVYRSARHGLVDELGLEPGPHLRELHHAVLSDDPRLANPAPAVRVAPAQLPADVAGFAGRRAQLDALDKHEGSRLICVTGTAGVGKTALAVRWAHRVRDRFPDGQLFLNLRGYAPGPPLQPNGALAQLLAALGVPQEQIPSDVEPAAALYRSLLADKRMLVLLDNAAHPGQIRPLLPGGAGCLVLVTSRDQLAGLVARDGAIRIALDVLSPAEARSLVTGLLGAEETGYTELAILCGHLPLALRIAAARITSSRASILDYVAQLRRNRLDALEIDNDPEAAVRRALDHSYAALPPTARRLFRLLGLAPGPDFAPLAAAALADLPTTPEATDLIRRLTAAHLIDEHQPGRHAMHDLVRLYAAERADAENTRAENESALGRLHDRYLRHADAAARTLYPEILRLETPASAPDFPDQARAMAWLDAERANLVAVCRQAAQHGPHARTAWRIADTLRGYVLMRRLFVDWAALAESGLAAATADGNRAAQAAIHLSMAMLRNGQGRYQESIEHHTAAGDHARAAGWAEGESAAVGNVGVVLQGLGRMEAAADRFEAGLAIARTCGWQNGQATRLANLGSLHWTLGRLETAAGYEAQSVALHRKAGSPSGEAIALSNLGEIYHELGRTADALATLTSAVTLLHRLGNRQGEADTTRAIAAVYRDLRRFPQALDFSGTALALARETDDQQTEASALATRAGIHHRMGNPSLALDEYRQAIELARANDLRFTEAEALIGLALTYRAAAHPRRAAEAARAALTIARHDGYRILEGSALTELAAADLAQHRTGHALSHAKNALAILRETGHRLAQSRAHSVIADAKRRLRMVAARGKPLAHPRRRRVS